MGLSPISPHDSRLALTRGTCVAKHLHGICKAEQSSAARFFSPGKALIAESFETGAGKFSSKRKSIPPILEESTAGLSEFALNHGEARVKGCKHYKT
jgi:hypothetical protein